MLLMKFIKTYKITKSNNDKAIFMRIFIVLLVLIFSLQSWTKADDIRDFEIEGMSIGDSALKILSKEELEEYKIHGFVYEDKRFYATKSISLNNFQIYDSIQFHIKAKDSNYTIYSITGKIIYKDNYEGCVLELENILPDLKQTFPNAKVQDGGVEIWKNYNNQEIKTKSYFLQLSSGDEIALECYDQPKERIYNFDSLKISIDSKEFVEFLHAS